MMQGVKIIERICVTFGFFIKRKKKKVLTVNISMKNYEFHVGQKYIEKEKHLSYTKRQLMNVALSFKIQSLKH